MHCHGSSPGSACVAVVALVALVAASPAPAPVAADEPGPPPVDLRRMRLTPDGAFAPVAPVAGGETAELTLDVPLQRASLRLLSQARPVRGAIVAIDPRTGHLLSWAGVKGSTPSPAAVQEALAPAASLFKLVTTAALLERGVRPDRTVCTHGGASFITREHLTPPRDGVALCAPFHEALGRSRNAVFAQLAPAVLEPEALAHAAERLGFGALSPFDVDVPMGTLRIPEGELQLARVAAGFEGSRLSPLGAAHLATTIAAGGQLVRLRIVRQAGEFIAPARRQILGRGMSEGAARRIVRMMEGTVQSGTCREVFSDESGRSVLGDVRVAAKTGTLTGSDRQSMTSWFVAIAPSRAPRIVVSVLLENGPGWRAKANELGRDFLQAYFADRGARGVAPPLALSR